MSAPTDFDDLNISDSDTTYPFVPPMDEPPTGAEGVSEPDQPDAAFLKNPRRTRGAAAYEKKVKNLLNAGMRITIQNPSTVADAAAIIMYGGEVAKTVGDLAAEDPWVRKAVDFLSGGADNPYLAAITAAAPLLLQILRNHEPVAEVPVRKVRIPFLKREFKLRVRFKLGKFRNLANDPSEFTAHVLSNPDVQNELRKQGIMFAGASNGNARN